MNFAFYGRVSTEDQQDPASSKGWQLQRATSLIEPHGGAVVEHFFDIGQSRSLPWKRRPEALRLLDTFKDKRRGFDAVVIGEPARAFYGNQFGLTFPVFVHYGVELWVPEVGGRVDPGSDAHDLVMSLYGGMSKGERNRIKVRVRSAMSSQVATDGRFQGGRPPYGYMLADAGAHPNPGKAADGKRLHRLEPDPVAAPIVQRIFNEYLGGKGYLAIAEALTTEGIPSPSGHDPARNRHREGMHGAWGRSAVRVILTNPRYTGLEVWNKQRRDEVLLDVEDVAAGHETKMRWNARDDWVWGPAVHEPLIDMDTFTAVQERMKSRGPASERSPRRTSRPYLLRSLMFCGCCSRRMEGAWVHDRALYRCRVPAEYGQAARPDHPRMVHVREDIIVPALDGWIALRFDPDNLDETCAALAAADDGPDEASAARAEQARRTLEECDAKIAKYRALLEDGTAPPQLVGQWLAEVQQKRERAARELASATPSQPIHEAEVRAMVAAIGDIAKKMKRATPAVKARVYADLGLRISYSPGADHFVVEAAPRVANARVGGGTRALPTKPVWREAVPFAA